MRMHHGNINNLMSAFLYLLFSLLGLLFPQRMYLLFTLSSLHCLNGIWEGFSDDGIPTSRLAFSYFFLIVFILKSFSISISVSVYYISPALEYEFYKNKNFDCFVNLSIPRTQNSEWEKKIHSKCLLNKWMNKLSVSHR